VEATVQLMMDQHAHEWSSHTEMGWIPKDRAARDAKLREEAHDKAAQIIRLNAYIASIDTNMESLRWAWREGGGDPVVDEKGVRYTAQRLTESKKFVDLLTALRGAAMEEMEVLDSSFRELAEWQTGVPNERLVLNAGVSTIDETAAASAPATVAVATTVSTNGNGSVIAADGSWICPRGHPNRAQANFCEYCDDEVRRPERDLVLTPPEVTSPVRVCLNGHELPPGAGFCPRCGAPEQLAAPPPATRVCLNGHELPPDAGFCPRCGAPEQPAAPPPATRVCLNGHELSPDASFCSKCGAPERALG
jgi:hypothetical protein